jgi:hypothetical protein
MINISIRLHGDTQHSTAQHSAAQHSAAQRDTQSESQKPFQHFSELPYSSAEEFRPHVIEYTGAFAHREVLLAPHSVVDKDVISLS